MEENVNIEQRATDTILQKGVKIPLRAPWPFRLFGKKKIYVTITSPFEGTMHRVASYYLRTGITSDELDDITTEQALALNLKHGREINRAVATAILNGYITGWLFVRPLAWYLKWHAKPQDLFAIIGLIILYGGTEDFINTTRSVRTMRLSVPRSGQKSQGS